MIHMVATAYGRVKARFGSALASVRARRRGRLVFGAIVALAVAGGAQWAVVRLAAPPALAGDVVTPPVQAYDFRLTDPEGRTVALSDFRGKAVAVTFLYTRCPDVCPLVAEHMSVGSRRLGDIASRVALVAVSVDPNGDTPEAVREFLKVHHAEGVLTYLRGSFAQLRPVWAHYYVGSDANEVNPEAVAASTPPPQLVGHTAVVYLIDPQGRMRALLPGNFEPRELALDLRLLLGRAR